MTIEDLKKYDESFVRFSSYREEKPEDLSSLAYGDLDRVKGEILPTDFYMVPFASGSDYSGDSVTVSNHRVFLEQFKDSPNVHDVYGRYSTYAVVVRVDSITEEMLEIFAGLKNYPLISEDDHGQVEIEAQNEAWDGWAREDFRRELIAKFPEQETKIEEMTDDNLAKLFYEAAEDANEYWQNETGNSAYIRLERIVADISLEDITQ